MMDRYQAVEVDYDPFADDETAPVGHPDPVMEAPPAARPAPEKPAPVSEPAPVETEAYGAPQAQPSAQPRQAFSEVEVDYDPFADEPPLPGKEDRPWAITRGMVGGLEGSIESAGGAVKMLQILSGGGSEPGALEEWLRSWQTGPQYEREVPSFTDIGGVGDAATYALESTGTAIGSMLPNLASGAIGATAGSVVPGVGTAAGAIAGGLAPSMPLGWGTVTDALFADKGIQDKLASGEMTEQDVARYALIGGTVVGGLDMLGLKKAAGAGAAAEKALVDGIVRTVVAQAGKGATAEGLTEMAQELISQGLQVYGGGNLELGKRLTALVDNGIAGVLGGGAIGAGSGAHTYVDAKLGKLQADKVTENKPHVPDEAQPATPPGVVDGGQSSGSPTPGGVSAATPPPPAGAARVPVTGTTVVQPGGVTPDVAAALGSPPAPTGVATAPVSPTSPVAVDEDLDEDPDIIPEPDEQGSVVDAPLSPGMQRVLERAAREQKAAETEIVVGGDPALQAAAVSSQPAPVVQPPAPVIPMPEPIGTAVAAQRRAQPTPVMPEPAPAPAAPAPQAILTPAEATPAPVPVAVAPGPALVEPQMQAVEVDYEPEFDEDTLFEDETRADMAPAASVAAFTAAPVQTAVEPVQAPPAPVPAPQAPVFGPEQRRLEQNVLSRFSDEDFAERPELNETIRGIVAAMPTQRPAGVSPAAHLEAQAAEAVAQVRSALEKGAIVKAAAEVQRAETQDQRARRISAERTVRRATKAKEKPASAYEKESERTLKRAVAKEMEKPEAERDPDLMEWERERQERSKTHQKGTANKLVRAVHTAKMEAAVARRAERKRQEEAARPAPEPEPEVVEPESKLGLTEEEVQEADRREKTKRNRVRQAKSARAVTPAILEVQQPNWDRMTMKSLPVQGKAFINDVAKAATAALKAAGLQPRNVIDTANNSMAENVEIFARKLASGKGPRGFGALELAQAVTFLKAGDRQNLYGLITNEAIDAREFTENMGDIRGLAYEQDDSGGRTVDFFGDEQVLGHAPGSTVSFATSRGQDSVRPAMHFKASDILRKIHRDVKEHPGFSLLRKMHNKALRDMVGDTDVYYVPQADMQRIGGATGTVNGLFINPSTVRVAAGDKSLVLMSENLLNEPDWFHAQVLVHELTHAATAQAIRSNVRGIKSVLENMMTAMQFDTVMDSRFDKIDRNDKYGFTNVLEFVAEAFSNPTFQEMMAVLPMPEELARQVRGLTKNPNPTWWDAFVRAVSVALGMYRVRGVTYLDGIISLHSTLNRSTQEQQASAAKAVQAWGARQLASQSADTAGLPAGPFDLPHMQITAKAAFEGARRRFDMSDTTHFGRKMANLFATTEEIKRRSAQFWGGEGNPLERLLAEFQSIRDQRNREKRKGDEITLKLARFGDKDPQGMAELSRIVYAATTGQYNPMEDRSHASNAHIKKGQRDQQRAAQHAKDRAAFLAMPEEAQKLMRELGAHHERQANDSVQKVVRNVLTQALRPKEEHGYGIQLPPGETIKSAIDWVLSGDIDKQVPADPSKPQSNERTARDQALHTALGSTAKTLANTAEFRRIKGFYAPLVRQGKYFFKATSKVDVPPGAELENGNELIFADKKDLNAYTSTTEETLSSIKSEWWDPISGKRTKKADVKVIPGTTTLSYPVQIWRVKVQNEAVEMRDTIRELNQARRDYERGGFTLTDNATLSKHLHAESSLAPAHVKALIRNVEQSSPAGLSKDATTAAIINASLRMQAASRAAHNRMFRKGTKGYTRDLVQATLTNNHVMAGHLAALDYGPKMAELDDAAERYGRNRNDGKNFHREAQLAEARKRIAAVQRSEGEFTGQELVQNLMNWSFIKHLMSPAYTIANLTQPVMVTYPVLASQFGDGATMRAMARALSDLQAGRILGRGFKELGLEAKQFLAKVPHHGYEYDVELRSKLDAAEPGFGAVMDEMRRLGFSVSGGIESGELNEIGQSGITKRINRISRVARAMPEAAEAVNRYVTALAAYRLAKRAGKPDPVKFAVTMVEKTQGGYASENNPAFMSHPFWRLPLQFKKYPLMYGQLFYGNLAAMLDTRKDPGVRKEAAKSLVRLSAMTTIFAGAAGLPFMEMARGMLLAANLFGLSDDDWDEWENGMQEWSTEALKWALGDTGEAMGEPLMRGLPRLLGIDTSSRLGNDSMLLFGSPKSLDEEGAKSWILDMIVGAPGGVISDMAEAFHAPDWSTAAGKVALPKFITDIAKATGKDSIGNAIAQGLGFRPAADVRKWEAGGSAAENKGEQKLKRERTALMGRWYNAGSQRSAFFRSEIRDWNRAHPQKHLKIEYSDLLRSKRRRDEEKRKDARL